MRRLVLLALIVVGGMVAASFLPLDRWLADVQLRIAALGPWAPLAFVALYVGLTILGAPGTALSLAAAPMFGPFWGVVWVSVGSTLGAGIAFLVARYLARDAVATRLAGHPLYERLERISVHHAALLVAVVRLVPLFPYNLVNYALGLTEVPFWTYLAVSWVAMLPGTILYVVGVDTLVRLWTGGELSWPVVLLLVALASLVAIVVRKIRRHLPDPSAEEAAGTASSKA